MKQSLYKIQEEYLQIAQALEQDEITPEIEQQLVITETALQEKAIGYAHVILDAETNVTAIKNEIKRLSALQKSEQNKADRLKSAISNAMQMFGINEVKTPTLKLSFRQSEGVVGESNTVLPEEFVTVVPEVRKPNLTAIKAAIKEGRTVEGYQIEQRQNLQIK